MRNSVQSICVLFALSCLSAFGLDSIPEIERRIPPKGLPLPPELQIKLEGELKTLQARVKKLKVKKVDTLDAEVFVKSLDYALVNGEFFRKADFALAEKMVILAKERLDGLEGGNTPWHEQRGSLVRG